MLFSKNGFLFFQSLRELKDQIGESDAACGLGQVYQQMGEYRTALRYHTADLETVEQLGLTALQARALGNLGSVHESLGNLDDAIRFQEQHLSVAAQTNDKLAKTLAYSSLGEIFLDILIFSFIIDVVSISTSIFLFLSLDHLLCFRPRFSAFF